MSEESRPAEHAVVVLITAPADQAGALARALVERRLAACVNVLPSVRSVYRWQGAVEEADEALLLVKSTPDLVEPMTALMRDLHPYENFELIALPVSSGSPPYLDWIVESTERRDGRRLDERL